MRHQRIAAAIVERSLNEIFVYQTVADEARGAVALAAALAVEVATRKLVLEALALELAPSENPLADSARSRRNARKRGRRAWLESVYRGEKLEKKTDRERVAEIELALDSTTIQARAQELLNVESLADVTFDFSTGKRVYSRDRIVKTISSLNASAETTAKALWHVGAFRTKKRKPQN